MTPQFKFTFFNEDLFPAGITVKQPRGWRDIKLILERHPDYHSLIEYFEGDLIWIGTARQAILDVLNMTGPDSRIDYLCEGRFSYAENFETIFNGQIDCSLFEETDKNGKPYKVKAPIIRNDFWSKFINRKSNSVDIFGTVDEDGNPIAAPVPFTLSMPSQVLEVVTKYVGSDSYEISGAGGIHAGGSDHYINIGLTREIGEISESFNLPFIPFYGQLFPGTVNDEFVNCIEMKEYGSIYAQFQGSAKITVDGNGIPINLSRFRIWVWKNNEAPTILLNLSHNNSGPAVDPYTHTYNINTVFNFGNLVPTDKIFIVFQWRQENDGDGGDIFDVTVEMEDMSVTLTGQTTIPDTTHEAILLKQAGEGIISKLTGVENVLVSPYLDSCKGWYALQKGLHVRGYTLEEKPFFMSLDDWWKGADGILCLSLDYNGETIVIGAREEQFDKTVSLNIGGIANVTSKLDTNVFPRNIKFGYEKWSAESDSGMDDSQTKRTYGTDHRYIGKDMTVESKFFAAALAIEQTRRNRVEQGKDWRLDEEIMIIALKPSGLTYVPEVGADFEDVTNVKNSDSRYNIRLFVTRNFERHRKWFNGAMQQNRSGKYFFKGGEGNFDASSTLPDGDCDVSDNMYLSEKQDIDVSASFMKLPNQYLFKRKFTIDQWKTILANKKQAIGLSRTYESYTPHFIEKLTYHLVKGYADFDVRLGDIPTELNGYRLLEDENFRLLEDDNLRELE